MAFRRSLNNLSRLFSDDAGSEESSSDSSAEVPGNVIMQGYLKKRCRAKKFIGLSVPRQWRQRYIVLKTDGLWSYSKKPRFSPAWSPVDDRDSPAPRKFERAAEGRFRPCDEEGASFIPLNKARVTPLGNLAFGITSSVHTYVFQASNEPEYLEWVKALEWVCCDNSIGMEDFEVLMCVGEGANGTVYQVRCIADNKIYAMKTINKSSLTNPEDVKKVIGEAQHMSYIQHSFIASLHCCFQTPEMLVFIMEFLGGGEIFQLVQEKPFPADVVRVYAAQLCLAVDYLHRNQITHRDIKPENLLLDMDGNICLADFGLSLNGPRQCKRRSAIQGSIAYMPPELFGLRGDEVVEITPAVDWWSLGCSLYYLACGEHPFMDSTGSVTPKDIMNKEPRLHAVDQDLRDLCSQLLNKDPAQRLGVNFQGLQQHRYFKNIDWDKVDQKEQLPQLDFLDLVAGDYARFNPAAVSKSIDIPSPVLDCTPAIVTQIESFSFTSTDFRKSHGDLFGVAGSVSGLSSEPRTPL